MAAKENCWVRRIAGRGNSLGRNFDWERKVFGKENSLNTKNYWAGEFAESGNYCWNGEATKRVETHQGRRPRRGAAAVEMGASCWFSHSRPSAANPSDPASRRELHISHRSSPNPTTRPIFSSDSISLHGDHRGPGPGVRLWAVAQTCARPIA
jgi:hypothetical protein